MRYIVRDMERHIRRALERDKSVLLLGARQTGKTTLLSRFNGDLAFSFVRPQERLRYEKNPGLLQGEIEAVGEKTSEVPLVLIDEVQKIPIILDVLQDLIDRNIAKFLITGSSARKLRRGTSVNLLPGRVVSLRLDALTIAEQPDRSLIDILIYGSLPGIVQVTDKKDREVDLESYVVTYLEEEVRAEALVRNIGSFARFLELAAMEAGRLINFRKLSQEIGVAHTTISSYYEILEDCLIIDRIEPIVQSRTRKRLTRSKKYLFFDLGVRRLCAKEMPSLHKTAQGHLFEQMVGLELLRKARLSDQKTEIRFWRDPGGPEVDWVIERKEQYIPVEVKWTEGPEYKDIKHIRQFIQEYDNAANGYLICRTPRAVKLADRITAIPWQDTGSLIDE